MPPPERGAPLSQLSERIADAAKERERARMDEAIAVLRARGALRDSHCPECGTDNWNVDFLAIPSVPLPEVTNMPPGVVLHFGISISSTSYIPAMTFVCTNCGYFKMFNLNLLGLGGRR